MFSGAPTTKVAAVALAAALGGLFGSQGVPVSASMALRASLWDIGVNVCGPPAGLLSVKPNGAYTVAVRRARALFGP